MYNRSCIQSSALLSTTCMHMTCACPEQWCGSVYKPLYQLCNGCKCKELLHMLIMVKSAGGEIFTKFGGWLNPANWPLNPLKDVTATAERLAWKRLYGDEGIERVLKDILRKPGWVAAASKTPPIILGAAVVAEQPGQ